MKQQELLNDVTKFLARFKEQVYIKNANSEFDINKQAENVLIKVLNIIYDTEFENANYKLNKNYSAIDLTDKQFKYSIQVTATPKNSKIKSTIKKYITSEHYNKFEKLLILILGKKQSRYTQTTIDNLIRGKMTFSVKHDIIDFGDLYTKLNELNDIDKISEVQQLLKKQFHDSENDNETPTSQNIAISENAELIKSIPFQTASKFFNHLQNQEYSVTLPLLKDGLNDLYETLNKIPVQLRELYFFIISHSGSLGEVYIDDLGYTINSIYTLYQNILDIVSIEENTLNYNLKTLQAFNLINIDKEIIFYDKPLLIEIKASLMSEEEIDINIAYELKIFFNNLEKLKELIVELNFSIID